MEILNLIFSLRWWNRDVYVGQQTQFFLIAPYIVEQLDGNVSRFVSDPQMKGLLNPIRRKVFRQVEDVWNGHFLLID